MKLFVKLEAPFEWARVSGRTVEAFGEVALASDYPLGEEEEIIGVVPGEWVTTHKLTLPARTKRQFLTALPYALEDALTQELDTLHFVCPEWKVNAESLVYVVSSEKMTYWQQVANQSELPLDRLVPDYSLLPLHEVADSTLAPVEEGNSRMLTHHKNGAGAALDEGLVDIWLSDISMNETVAVTQKTLIEQLIERHPDRDFRLWEVGSKMAHWLEQGNTSGLDLMSDRFRPSVRKLEWANYKWPAAMVAAALALVLSFDVFRYFSLHHEIQNVISQQSVVLQSAFPEIQQVPDGGARPLMERALKNRVGEPEPHSANSLLAVTAKVLRQQRVALSEVSFRDGRLSVTCLLNNLSQVDQITRNLNADGRIAAQLESSANDDGQILASYTIAGKS